MWLSAPASSSPRAVEGVAASGRSPCYFICATRSAADRKSPTRSAADGAKRLSVVDDDAERLVEAKQPRKCAVANTDSPSWNSGREQTAPAASAEQQVQ